jgi:hypothetical protein
MAEMTLRVMFVERRDLCHGSCVADCVKVTRSRVVESRGGLAPSGLELRAQTPGPGLCALIDSRCYLGWLCLISPSPPAAEHEAVVQEG